MSTSEEILNLDHPVPMEKRSTTSFSLGILWFTIVLVGPSWMVPALAIGAAGDFKAGIIIVLIADFLGAIVVGLSSYAPWKYGIPQMSMYKTPMGTAGSKIPSFLNGLMLIFFVFVQTIIAAIGLQQITNSGDVGFNIWVAVIGIVASALAYFGHKYIEKFEKAAAIVSIIVFLGALIVLLQSSNVSDAVMKFNSANKPSLGGYATAFEIIFSFVISWGLMPGDFTRWGKDKTGPTFALPLGFFLGMVFLIPVAGVALVVTGAPDPGTALAKIGYGPFFVIGLLFSTLVSNAAVTYAAGWSLSNSFGGGANFRKVLLATSIVCILGAFWKNWLNLESWLLVLASFLAPTFGVGLTNFFFFENRLSLNPLVFLNSKEELTRISIPGTATWFLGLGFYWVMHYLFPASLQYTSLFTILFTGIVYYIWESSVKNMQRISGSTALSTGRPPEQHSV